MCDPATAAIIGTAVLGVGESERQGHQERKAAKSKEKGLRKAATEKEIADKEALKTAQENVATSQAASSQASSALESGAESVKTGAEESFDSSALKKRVLLGV